MSMNSDNLIMPVAPTGNGFSGGNGWGMDGSWWIIILFLFVFCGWGGNAWGGNNGGGVMDGYVLTSDFANIERKIDGVNNGLCDGFYSTAQLINGVQQNMNNGFMTAELSRCNQQAALMQQLFNMQTQNSDCCCEIRNAIQTTTRDIIDNQNSNSRAILDFLNQSKMRDLESENQSLKLAASQAAQNNYIISQLRPSPAPAYVVQNPYCCNSCMG